MMQTLCDTLSSVFYSCYSCCSSDAEERMPLLSGTDSSKLTPQLPRKHLPSPRKFRIPENFLAASKTGINVITMKHIGVADVDKRLKDHAELFNSQVKRWYDLERFMEQLKVMFPHEEQIKSIPLVFAHVKTIIDSDPELFSTILVRRRHSYCLEIEYDEKTTPFSVLPTLSAFNHANRLIREMIDKDGPLRTSMQLVVQEEDHLRREVLVASFEGKGPDNLKHTMDNVMELRRAVNISETIREEALRNFTELRDAVTPLCDDGKFSD